MCEYCVCVCVARLVEKAKKNHLLLNQHQKYVAIVREHTYANQYGHTTMARSFKC